MKEVEDKDRVSKTMLITNVLCVEDDFMLKSPPFPDKVHYSHNLPLIPNGFHHKRWLNGHVQTNKYFYRSQPKTILESFSMSPPVKHELELILKEIKIITDKIKEDDNTANISGDWKFAAMVLDRWVWKEFFFIFSWPFVTGCVWYSSHLLRWSQPFLCCLLPLMLLSHKIK